MCLEMGPWHGEHRTTASRGSSIIAGVSVAAETCLPSQDSQCHERVKYCHEPRVTQNRE
jgi:hypothetical protein